MCFFLHHLSLSSHEPLNKRPIEKDWPQLSKKKELNNLTKVLCPLHRILSGVPPPHSFTMATSTMAHVLSQPSLRQPRPCAPWLAEPLNSPDRDKREGTPARLISYHQIPLGSGCFSLSLSLSLLLSLTHNKVKRKKKLSILRPQPPTVSLPMKTSAGLTPRLTRFLQREQPKTIGKKKKKEKHYFKLNSPNRFSSGTLKQIATANILMVCSNLLKGTVCKILLSSSTFCNVALICILTLSQLGNELQCPAHTNLGMWLIWR